MERIGGTAAGAVQLRPALGALRPGVGVAAAELLPQGVVCDAVPDVAQAVGLFAHELMAGIEVPQGVTAMYSVPEPQPEIRL